MNLKNSILSYFIKKRKDEIDWFSNNPLQSQEGIFKDLIQKGCKSIFGQDHNFKEIKSYKDFTKNIPIRTYEELFPYIEKIRNGEENVLWSGQNKWFAKSSGTTNAKSKFIPVSKESLYESHFKAGKDMLALYCNNFPQKSIFNGKGLMLGGSQTQNKKHGFIEGDLSAILIENFPFWVKMHQNPNSEIVLLDDWEEKIKRITEKLLHENITNMTGVPSWMYLLLQNIVTEKGVNTLIEVWPNLEVYIHGGIDFSSYKSNFKKLIGSDEVNYLEIYNASEGFFGIQDDPLRNDLLLMLNHGIFYEFIPIKKFRNGIMETTPLEGVQQGEDYVLIISTCSGLWRYLIGDTVNFTSIKPYKIIISGRTKNYINMFGEELMIGNTNQALHNTCQSTSSKVSEYTVSPILYKKMCGAHEWIIEFETPPLNIKDFQIKLDVELKKVNSDYAAKRSKDLLIKPPIIRTVKKGTFYNWSSANNRLGGQYKIPRLSNKRTFAEEIIKYEN